MQRTLKAPAPLWRDTSFRAFWAGQAVSQLGVQLGQLALPVLAVVLLGAVESELGILSAAGTAAFLLVGLPAGAWVDRWRKRRVMIAADIVRSGAMLAVPFLWWGGLLEVWHLYAVAGVIGVATVFFDVAYQSFIPLLVPREQVADANGKLEATAQISRIGGPALGGFLLQVLSAPLLFLAESLGYLVSAGFLRRVRAIEPAREAAPGRSLVAEIREGAVFVVRHPLIRRVTLSTAVANFFSSAVFVLVPLLVLRDLQLGAAGMGTILSVGALGGILAAIAVPRLATVLGEGPLIPLGALLFGIASLAFPLAAGMGGPSAMAILCAGEFFVSFGVIAFNVMQLSMRQRVCPPDLLGRMNATIRCLVWGVMPLGSLVGGWLGSEWGLPAALWAGVLGQLLAFLPVGIGPFFGLRKLPDSVAD